MANVKNFDKFLKTLTDLEKILMRDNFDFGAVENNQTARSQDVKLAVKRLKKLASQLSVKEADYVDDFERKQYDKLIKTALRKGMTFDDIAKALNSGTNRTFNPQTNLNNVSNFNQNNQ